MNATETECPICDRKVQSDQIKCPNCGSDLTLSSFEDLEKVANNLPTSEVQEPSEANVAPKGTSSQSEPKIEEIKPTALPSQKKEEPEEPLEPKKEERTTIESSKDEGKHGLGRLFGKKKK
jgi:zinc-ribbon domain